MASTETCSLSAVQSTDALAILPLRASYKGCIKWATGGMKRV